MSKSKNNFFTVREVAQQYGYEPIRYLMISSHYRSPINYAPDIMEQCKSAVQRLYNFKENLKFAVEKSSLLKEEAKINLEDYKLRFINALSDDLNTADALGIVFELVKEVNSNILSLKSQSRETLEKVMLIFNEMMSVLGLLYENKNSEDNKLNLEIENLIKLRENARKEKNWKRADELRDLLNSKGVTIEDTPQGTKFSFK